MTVKFKFTPQQITAIKNSPKGQVPKFITAGIYNKGGIKSVGGKIGNIGGSIGYDKNKKKAFGSINYKGKIKGSFGPQD